MNRSRRGDETAEPTTAAGSIEDRMRALEEEVREWKAKYTQLCRYAPAGIYEINFKDWKFDDVNEVMSMHTGYSRQELLAMDPRNLLSEDSRMAFFERFQRMLAGEDVPETPEYQIVCKNGQFLWIRLNVRIKYQHGLPVGAMVVFKDVSDIRRIEAAREDTEKKYRLLFENAIDPIVLIQDERIALHNPMTEHLTGYSAEELSQMPFIDLIHPDDRSVVMTRYRKRLAGISLTNLFDFRFLAKAGQTGWVQVNAVNLTWEGKPSILCVLRDVTRLKSAEMDLQQAHDRLEEQVAQRTAELMETNRRLQQQIEECHRSDSALRESENKYKTLVDNLPDIIFSSDRHGRITHINLPAESCFGFRALGIIGKPFTSLIYSKDRQMVENYFGDGVDHEIKIIRGLQFRIVSKGGLIHWVEVNLQRQFDAKTGQFAGTDGVIRDITETKSLQEHLIRSERLAATGQLATSIAHEINSPLQTLTRLIEAVKAEVPEDSVWQAHLRSIESAYAAIDGTIQNLLEINRPDHGVHKPVSLNQIIENTVALTRSYLKEKRVTVHLHLAEHLPRVMASPSQISQVLMNLINNAIEAMNGVSTLKAGAAAAAKGGTITICSYPQADGVVVEVRDSGPGIDDAELERIFDPGFTHKKKRGVGVGLPVCHGIIADHHGTLSAGNGPHGGALFEIKLPAAT